MIQTTPSPPNHPQPEVAPEYDVIVIGGGPAGSTVAALVAASGRRTLVLERAAFPRFHIGESLIPETYWTLERLGLLDELRKSAFPKKYSVQFYTETGEATAPFYFDDYKPHESSQTWQVVRGEFDKLLLDNAAGKGATVRTDAQVLDVLFDNDRAVGVRVKFGNGDERQVRDIPCRVVVDATGQSAFLATRLGLKQPDRRLKNGAVWTYFQGAKRDPGKDEGATLIMHTFEKKSWFWYIPLPNDIVSIGVTGSMNYIFAPGRGTPEDIYTQELERCPALQERLADATRVTDYLTTKDFTYRASRAAGPGWVLVGDAAGFIDPIYSTGVFLALKSGEFAADAIAEAFETKDFSGERLGGWHGKFTEGLELFRKLVYAFYTPEFSFGDFLRKHPRFRDNLTDMLMGDVFRPGVGEMFDYMGEVLPPDGTQ